MAGTTSTRSRRVVAAVLAVVLLAAALVAAPVAPSTAAAAEPGDLDTSYGVGGVASTPHSPGANEGAAATAVDSFGRIVTVGTTQQGDTRDILVTRHLADDGAFDPSFGDGGRVTFDAGTGSDEATDVVIDHLGRIVVVGATGAAGSGFLVLRFLQDGSLDPTFGGGVVNPPFDGVGDRAEAVRVASNGDVVVAGSIGTNDGPQLGLIRLDETGALVPGFGNAGKTVLDLQDPRIGGFDFDAEGRIVVGLTLVGGANDDFAAVRFSSAGAHDPGFGPDANGDGDPDGILVAPVGAADDTVAGVVVEPSGGIILAGTAIGPGGTDTDLAAIRLTPDGSVDPAYDDTPTDDDGTVFVDFTSGQDDVAGGVSLRPGGGVFIGGTTFRPEPRIATAYLEPSGRPQFVGSVFNGGAPTAEGFGVAVDGSDSASERHVVVGRGAGRGDDLAIVRIGTGLSVSLAQVHDYEAGRARVRDVAVQADGSSVAVGRAGSDLRISRHRIDGSLDPTFDDDGIRDIDLGSSADEGTAVALRPDGRIVVATRRSPLPLGRVELLQLLPSGAFDPSFGGGDGRASSLTVSPDGELADLALRQDGSIVAAGSAGGQALLAKFLADGTTDGGQADPLGGRTRIAAVAVDANGGIVLAGTSETPTGGAFVVVRHHGEGGIDTAFGDTGTGYTTIGFPTPIAVEAHDVVIQPDGAIVLAGAGGTCAGSGSGLALARLHDNGLLDDGFGDGGVRSDCATFADDNALRAVAIQTDGAIVAAGHAGAKPLVARYLADGSIDPSFGTEGKVEGAPLPGQSGQHFAIALQQDGHIIAGGAIDAKGSLVRYLGTPPAEPEPIVAGPTGQIAFTAAGEPGNPEIYVLDPEGGAPQRLTDSPGIDSDPSFSPDGSRIAYVRDANQGFQVWTMAPDGSDPRQVTTMPDFTADPVWSPDGDTIAFASIADGDFDIYTVAAGGAPAPTKITHDTSNEGFPTWSPDGTRLAFRSDRDGATEIYAIDTDGTDLLRLTETSGNDQYAAWSPDGSTIAFTSERDGNQELYLMGADGTNERRLTTTSWGEEFPAWSPDGAHLVAGVVGSTQDGLALIDPVSGEAAPITPTGFGGNNATWADNLTLTAVSGAASATSPSAVPLEHLPLQPDAPDVRNAPISQLRLGPLSQLRLGPLSQARLGPISQLRLGPLSQLRLGPLSQLRLGVGPIDDGLRQVPLSTLPLLRPGGWTTALEGTSLAGRQLHTVSLYDVVVLPPDQYPNPTLAELDFSQSPLGEVSAISLALGRTPLSAIPIPDFDWCAFIASEGSTCAAFGGLDVTTLLDLQIAGVNLDQVPLDLLRVQDIDLQRAPAELTTLPLSSFDLGAMNLGALPLGEVVDLAAVVDCNGTFACLGASLAEAQDASAIRSAATMGTLLPSIGGLNFVDLVFGFFPAGVSGVEDIAPAALGVEGYRGAGTSIVGFRMDYVTVGHPDGAVKATIQLPTGFAYEPATATFRIGDGDALGIEPTLLGDQLVFDTGATPAAGQRLTIELQARPGLVLGRRSSAARINHGTHEQAVHDRAPIQIGEYFEGNDAPASATPIATDTVYLSHIGRPGDLDYFSLPLTEGSTVTVFLSQEVDNDLVLYAPAGATPSVPLRAVATPQTPVQPLTDAPPSLSRSGEPLAAETLEDVPIADLPVLGLSDRRADGKEVIQSLVTTTGVHTLQVSGYNGLDDERPYALRVLVTPPSDRLPCAARRFAHDEDPYGGADEAASAGADLPSTIAPTTQTLFLVARDRLHDLYGEGPTKLLLDDLTTLSGHERVRGEVLAVDTDPNVREAFRQWDLVTGVCDPERANDVVRAINGVVDARTDLGGGSIRNVVLVGADEALPFARVQDLTQTGNERAYESELPRGATDHALLASFGRGYVQSDDAYADPTPTPYLGRWQYVAELALGRLVEHPDDIRGQIETFLGSADGRLAPETALTTGYDFMRDLGRQIDDGLNAALNSEPTPIGGFGAAPAEDLVTDGWTGDDLHARFTGASDPADLLALNAHFDHATLQPASAAGRRPVLTTADLDGAVPMPGRVLFTMGCHSGTSVADVLIGSPTDAQAPRLRDWAQSTAAKRATMVGQTGYGLGLDATVAYSERVLRDFARNLTGPTTTVGQALVAAKQRYVGSLAVTGVYDNKTLAEATFYGLPMWEVGSGSAAPAPAPRPTTTDALTGLTVADITSTPTLQPRSTDDGTFLEVGGEALVVHGQPIQPRLELDVTVPGKTARGALITSLQSADDLDVDPVFARPVLDLAANEPEIDREGAVFPAAIQAVQPYRSPAGPRQNLVLVPGQFQATGLADGEVIGRQRRFTSIRSTVYYGDGEDVIPATFSRAEAAVVPDPTGAAGAAGFSVDVADDEGPVRRVVVMYLDESGLWQRAELVQDAERPTRWTGAGPATGRRVQFFAQAVDGNGNVALTTNKGDLFAGLVVEPTPIGFAAEVGGTEAPAGNGWFAEAAVRLDGPGTTSFEYSIDDAPYQAYTGPFGVAGEGIHLVRWRASTGETGTVSVPVDSQRPTIEVISPAQGASYTTGAPVVVEYRCKDAGSGVTRCEGPVASGAALDTSTAGSRTFSVVAEDDAGFVHRLSHGYTVAPKFRLDGFFAPVDNTQLNQDTAGRSVPFKWRLYDSTGAEVTSTSGISVRSFTIACPNQPADTIEESATTNLGMVYYDTAARQFRYNWKTDKGWTKTCRRFEVTLPDGSTAGANFRFK